MTIFRRLVSEAGLRPIYRHTEERATLEAVIEDAERRLLKRLSGAQQDAYHDRLLSLHRNGQGAHPDLTDRDR